MSHEAVLTGLILYGSAHSTSWQCTMVECCMYTCRIKEQICCCFYQLLDCTFANMFLYQSSWALNKDPFITKVVVANIYILCWMLNKVMCWKCRLSFLPPLQPERETAASYPTHGDFWPTWRNEPQLLHCWWITFLLHTHYLQMFWSVMSCKSVVTCFWTENQ